MASLKVVRCVNDRFGVISLRGFPYTQLDTLRACEMTNSKITMVFHIC